MLLALNPISSQFKCKIETLIYRLSLIILIQIFVPLIPQQQAAAPRLPPPPARPNPPLLAQPPPHPRHQNDFDFNLPLRHMNRNLARNFDRYLPLGQPVVPLPVLLPANPPNPIINLAPPPPPPALPVPGMGQPIIVPQFIRQAPAAPPPPVLPQPQPVPAGQPLIPDNMRVTRALRHHNNIQLLPPLSAIYKQSPFTANQAVASGPSLVSDHLGLPVVKPGSNSCLDQKPSSLSQKAQPSGSQPRPHR
jgi:hypothetical protein